VGELELLSQLFVNLKHKVMEGIRWLKRWKERKEEEREGGREEGRKEGRREGRKEGRKKKRKALQVWWHTPVIQETEAGRSLK
jgi:flagellar biosynthesis/type III secretory pathway protein FliH